MQLLECQNYRDWTGGMTQCSKSNMHINFDTIRGRGWLNELQLPPGGVISREDSFYASVLVLWILAKLLS